MVADRHVAAAYANLPFCSVRHLDTVLGNHFHVADRHRDSHRTRLTEFRGIAIEGGVRSGLRTTEPFEQGDTELGLELLHQAEWEELTTANDPAQKAGRTIIVDRQEHGEHRRHQAAEIRLVLPREPEERAHARLRIRKND